MSELSSSQGRTWAQHLVLSAARLQVFLPAVEALAARDVQIMTLAQAGATALPAFYELLKATSRSLGAGSLPAAANDYDQFQHWLARPEVDGRLILLARSAEVYAGYTVLTRSEGDNDEGRLIDNGTATDRAFKRQGITLALRVRGIQQAQRLGYDSITTYTDAENFTMLALNEKLGFERAYVRTQLGSYEAHISGEEIGNHDEL